MQAQIHPWNQYRYTAPAQKIHSFVHSFISAASLPCRKTCSVHSLCSPPNGRHGAQTVNRHQDLFTFVDRQMDSSSHRLFYHHHQCVKPGSVHYLMDGSDGARSGRGARDLDHWVGCECGLQSTVSAKAVHNMVAFGVAGRPFRHGFYVAPRRSKWWMPHPHPHGFDGSVSPTYVRSTTQVSKSIMRTSVSQIHTKYPSLQ